MFTDLNSFPPEPTGTRRAPIEPEDAANLLYQEAYEKRLLEWQEDRRINRDAWLIVAMTVGALVTLYWMA
jgi:hypothetical protein